MESTSKDDRGVVHVETKGYNQDGTLVCIFRRKVMVPKENWPRGARRGAARHDLCWSSPHPRRGRGQAGSTGP